MAANKKKIESIGKTDLSSPQSKGASPSASVPDTAVNRAVDAEGTLPQNGGDGPARHAKKTAKKTTKKAAKKAVKKKATKKSKRISTKKATSKPKPSASKDVTLPEHVAELGGVTEKTIKKASKKKAIKKKATKKTAKKKSSKVAVSKSPAPEPANPSDEAAETPTEQPSISRDVPSTELIAEPVGVTEKAVKKASKKKTSKKKAVKKKPKKKAGKKTAKKKSSNVAVLKSSALEPVSPSVEAAESPADQLSASEDVPLPKHVVEPSTPTEKDVNQTAEEIEKEKSDREAVSKSLAPEPLSPPVDVTETPADQLSVAENIPPVEHVNVGEKAAAEKTGHESMPEPQISESSGLAQEATETIKDEPPVFDRISLLVPDYLSSDQSTNAAELSAVEMEPEVRPQAEVSEQPLEPDADLPDTADMSMEDTLAAEADLVSAPDEETREETATASAIEKEVDGERPPDMPEWMSSIAEVPAAPATLEQAETPRPPMSISEGLVLPKSEERQRHGYPLNRKIKKFILSVAGFSVIALGIIWLLPSTPVEETPSPPESIPSDSDPAVSTPSKQGDATDFWRDLLDVAPAQGDLWTLASLDMTLVFIEAGECEMGSDSSTVQNDERPAHTVTISRGYWLGTYEITNKQYRQFVNQSGYQGAAEADKNYMRPQLYTPQHPSLGDDYPVIAISWHNAMAFCQWLTRQESQAQRLPRGYAFCLPTEAQWEYAARGGSRDQTTYAGSNRLDDVAWFLDNSAQRCQRVGAKQANALGLYDMSGNVWEWCLDWRGPYTSDKAIDPVGPEVVIDPNDPEAEGLERINRGGSWFSSSGNCRITNRGFQAPMFTNSYLGFRVALVPRVTAKESK